LLEYDDERAGTFEPLRLVPRDRIVVLGPITTKKPQMEKVDATVRCIEKASKFFPLDHLILTPQCGFASTAEGDPLAGRCAVGPSYVSW
jgi:5-methyltetrahydropteroyltriglutamate--homocysteine methyltransferase